MLKLTVAAKQTLKFLEGKIEKFYEAGLIEI